jgi:hypothetical protein
MQAFSVPQKTGHRIQCGDGGTGYQTGGQLLQITLLDQIDIFCSCQSIVGCPMAHLVPPWINYLFIMIFGLTNKPPATTV